MTVDGALAVPIAGSLVAAIVALFAKIFAVQRAERLACDDRIAALEARIRRIEDDTVQWRDRWRREVERSVELAAIPSDGRPRRPPPPHWEENTGVRDLRAALEARALDAELRRYADSTPPRQALPPPPRRP